MSVDKILEERGKRYNLHGTYADHAELTQDLKDRMRKHPGWAGLTGAMKETLDMIQHKIARILNGDPKYKDNWDDIQGYTKLVADKLEKNDG